MSPLPNLLHWWSIEAMIASYNHVYKVVHNTQYYEMGPIGVSDYGTAPIASFQLEFLAMDDNPQKVVNAIREYGIDGRRHVLDVFHDTPSARDLKTQYAEYGYEFVRTGPILGYDIPVPVRGETMDIIKVESQTQLNEANAVLYLENETIHPETLHDPHIVNFIAKWNGRVAGWVQLVTVYPGAGYINQLYTITDFRNLHIASSLMARAHVECVQHSIPRMTLVSSDMALGLYRRLGYRPLTYFTVLRPKDEA